MGLLTMVTRQLVLGVFLGYVSFHLMQKFFNKIKLNQESAHFFLTVVTAMPLHMLLVQDFKMLNLGSLDPNFTYLQLGFFLFICAAIVKTKPPNKKNRIRLK